MDSLRTRKIIHVDMDAFYASVEQRDHPEFANQPVAVGYADKRGVVATASYEARKYGVHSALPSVTAKKLCPQLIFLAPRFDVYRSVSAQVREIFAEHTDLIEPVSLDEAYLDVSESKKHIPSAWTSAQVIRDEIFKRTGLTASAGVSYSKFLAKILLLRTREANLLISYQSLTSMVLDPLRPIKCMSSALRTVQILKNGRSMI
jgi:DNA polymerase-4